MCGIQKLINGSSFHSQLQVLFKMCDNSEAFGFYAISDVRNSKSWYIALTPEERVFYFNLYRLIVLEPNVEQVRH